MIHRIPLAAVLGHPVAHSRSPALQGHWLARYDIPGHYIPIDVGPDDLGQALRQLPSLGFVGANVTIPHKEAALALATTATDRAKAIGAANTLTFGEDGAIHADNTDGYGFLANLTAGAPNWRPESGTALVLGAGGAARGMPWWKRVTATSCLPIERAKNRSVWPMILVLRFRSSIGTLWRPRCPIPPFW